MDTQPSHENVAPILEQITAAGLALKNGDANSRAQLVGLAYRLAAGLELPSEALIRMMWAEPARAALCKMSLDLGIFEQLKESGEAGMKDEDVAKAVKADPVLIGRALKHLAAMNLVHETSAGHYAATRMSNAFTETRFKDGINYLYDLPGPSFRALPEYLEKTKYQNPADLTDGPFQFAHGTKLPFFDFLKENPKQGARFNNYMAGYRAGRPVWFDPGFFPVSERLVSTFNAENSPVMIVDIGGGLGHDMVDLKKQHPDLPGEIIVQDLDSVVASIPDTETNKSVFKAMTYDFFQPQPVQHARAYHLHSALHGWDDENCVKALRNTAQAMKRGYSSVLIFEMVVPPTGAPWPVTSEDMLIAVLGAMHERTRSEWESILHQAGLKISKVWSVEMGSESLIEAELA